MANRDTVRLLLEHLGKPWSLVRHVEDRPGPRPALRDGRHARSRRSAGSRGPRSRTGWPHDRLVRRQRALVARRPIRRLGRLLRAPVRIAPAVRRLTGRRLMRVAVTGANGRLGRALVDRPRRCPVHGPGRADRLDARGLRPRRTGGDRRAPRPRPTRGRRQRRGLDRRRRLRPRPRPRAAPQRRGGPRARRGDRRARHRPGPGQHERGVRRRSAHTTAAIGPTIHRAPANPYGAVEARRRGRGGGRLPGSSRRASRSSGRRGCTGRPATTSRRRSSPRPSAPAPTASRSRSSATSSGRRRSPTTSPRRSSSCSARATSAASITSSTPASRRGPTGRASSSARPASTSPIEEVPAVDLAARLDAAGVGRARADAAPVRRAAAAMAAGARRLPAALLRQRAAAAPMTADRDLRDPASATARSSATATSAARSARSGARTPATRSTRRRPAPRRAPSHGSSRPTCRARRPACCAACISTDASSTAGSWPPAGRSSRSSTSARCSMAADRPVVETRELGADDWVEIPVGVAHGFLALEPLELVYLVTTAYDGSDELGFAWDDPLAAVPWPARRCRRRTGGRSCPTATARTPRSTTSWCACAPGADRPDPRRPHRLRTGPQPASADVASAAGTMPRLSGPRMLARLKRSVIPHPAERRCIEPSSSPCSLVRGRRFAGDRAGRARRGPAEPGQGRDRRRRHARRHGVVPGAGGRGLRRGEQAHVQRRQGVQPERDVVEGQGRGGRRVGAHLLRPRQRLAQPVHLRPELHDEGRVRAQLRHQPRRPAVRQREPLLRRAVRARRSTSPRTRS